MKGRIKGLVARIAAFAATLAFALGPVTPAFAAEAAAANTGSITVAGIGTTDAKTTTTTAYKIVDAVYATSGQFAGYKWNDAVKNWINTNYSKYSDITKFNEESVNGDTAKAFYDHLAAAIKGGDVKVTAAGTVKGNGNIDGLAVGNYLLITEGGVNIYSPAAGNVTLDAQGAAQDVTVNVKQQNVSLEKKVDEKKIVGAQYGDTVNYDLNAPLPSYPADATAKQFQIGDKAPQGIDIQYDSITAYGVNADGEETKLTATDDYVLTYNNGANQVTSPDGSNEQLSFLVNFKYDRIKNYASVHIDYNGVINHEAQVGPTGNVNEAKLYYSNDPYNNNDWNHVPSTGKVFSYGLKVNKVDGATNAALTGAEFTIAPKPGQGQTATPIEVIKESDGVYHVYDAKTDDATKKTATLAVGAADAVKGQLTIKGLKEGTYQLTETKTPSGYNAPIAPFEVTLKDADDSGALDGKLNGGDDQGYLTYTVSNVQGFQLPKTGGIGTAIFTAVGVVLVGGGFALIARRRMGQR